MFFAPPKFLRTLSLIALLVLSTISQVLAAESEEIHWSCYGLIIPNTGKLVQSGDKVPFTAEEQSEYQIYILSNDENQMYRLTSRTRAGVSKVIKVYTQPRALENDMLAFQSITEANSNSFIKVIDRQVVDSNTLQLQNLRGRSLKEILGDSSVDARARAILLERYRSFLEIQVKNLRTRFGEAALIVRSYQEPWSVHVRISDFPQTGRSLKIFLRSDNILVESNTANLYLINPY